MADQEAIIAIVHSDPPEIEPRLWRNVPGEGVAYYIGANCGQHLGELASRFHRIFCFEPNEASYARLVEAVPRITSAYGPVGGPHPAIDTMRLAVSSYDGVIELADLPGTRAHATGQLVTMGHRGMEWEPPNWGDRKKVVPVRVQCKTLDTLVHALGEPDFVTMDTEGHEWLIMQGAGRTITEARPDWLIEFHSMDNFTNIRTVLVDHGYTVETVRHPHYPMGSPMWKNHGWIKAHHNHEEPPDC